MHFSTVLKAVVPTLWFFGHAHAKYVFAHYMVGTTTEDHVHQDIDDAMAMGLDGFALNVGVPTAHFVPDVMSSMFGYAAYRGFKLFVSMDLYAYGDFCYKANIKTCNGPFDYYNVMAGYIGSSAWFRDTPNGKPMISTFSSGGFHWDNFRDWRQSWGNNIYFVPNFDETAGYYDSSDAWWYYWGNTTDGVFSWEASWPESSTRPGYGGQYPGDISQDLVVIAAAHTHNHSYMMGLSTLQYKNSYGANVYRGGEDNLPRRMVNILSMNPQPDYIQIITWNDFPESHNIGNTWPEQNTDVQPNTYGNLNDWPHQAWQGIHTSFIKAWKAGGSPATMAPVNSNNQVEGVMWYKTILQGAACVKDNQGDKFYNKPDNFDTGEDFINYAIVVAPGVSGLSLRCYSQGVQIDVDRPLHPGLNYGVCEDMTAGHQKLVVLSGGVVLYSAVSVACVDTGCPQDIYNMNYQTVAVTSGDKTASCYDYTVGTFSSPGIFVQRTADWQTVTCIDPGITNAALNQSLRWADVHTDDAWAAAVANWTANPNPGGLTFSEQISNFFNGPENMNCGDISNNNGCTTSSQCNSVNHPAGYFILNSLGLVSQLNANFYSAIGTAESDMTTKMGTFASTFSPIKDESKVEEIVLDIVEIGFAVAAGPIWTKALKAVPFFANNPETVATLKEETNTLLAFGIPIANEAKSGSEGLDVQNTLTTAMGNLIASYHISINNINVALFNGSESSIALLGSLISGGRLMEPSATSTDLSAAAYLKQAVFGYLIPRAWAVSDDGTHAFIIDSGNDCSKLGNGLSYMSDKTAAATGVCFNSKAYYLVSATQSADCTQTPCSGQVTCSGKFSAPPGLDQLTPNNGWGNVQPSNLVIGALNGYAANGNANGWPLADLSKANTLSDLNDDGIQAAGVVQIPICGLDTAIFNWKSENFGDNYPLSAYSEFEESAGQVENFQTRGL